MHVADTLTDEMLWHHFSSQTLSQADWNHRRHLRVAWLHLERWPLDIAHIRMRVGIILLNAAHGLIETETRGYHETLTRFWLETVARLRANESRVPNPSPEHTSFAFYERHPELLEKGFPLAFYRQEDLFSGHARACWVEPVVPKANG